MRKGIGSLVVYTLVATVLGCGSEPPDESTRSAAGLALTVDVVADTDVAGMRFELTRVSCNGESIQPWSAVEEAPLADLLIPGGMPELNDQPLDAQSQHVFADKYFAVDPGCYDVTTTPLDAAGQPSSDCAPATERGVVVLESETTEILLVNQCEGDTVGGLDTISALNHPPEILDLTFERSKFGNACQAQTVCVTARDPDHDPLEFEWNSATGLPLAGPTPVSRTENADGSVTDCVSFVPAEAGQYDFTVTAFDLLHAADGSLIRFEQFFADRGEPRDSRASLDFWLHEADLACQREYTADPDFNLGTLYNVNHAPNHNQLQLNIAKITPFPFVCMALSNDRGSIVRFDANTGEIVGEYRTAPEGMATNSSRTTVDDWGNCWVGNRDEAGPVGAELRGSIAKVGVIRGGTRGDKVGDTFVENPAGEYIKLDTYTYTTCVDRDGDGLIHTSTGLGNVLAWPNVDGSAGSAADECVLAATRTIGTNVRHLSVDANNDVWVGGRGNRMFEKLDGTTTLPIPGTQRQMSCGGYGGLVDGNGVVWSSSGSGEGLLRYDPATDVAECLFGRGEYGLAVDPTTGHIWHSGINNPTLFELDSDGNVLHAYPQPFQSQGVAVDQRGHVWMASAGALGYTSVWHLAPGATTADPHVDAGIIGNLGGPTGIAVDTNGMIWVSEYLGGSASRIDPSLNGGTGAVDLGPISFNVPGLPAGSPYNYSDMTGIVAAGVSQPSGFWQVTHEGCAAGTRWASVAWHDLVPANTSLVVEARASDDIAALTLQAWRPMTNGAGLCDAPEPLVGQYLQVRVVFGRDFDTPATPVLEDLSVQCCE
jgi:streptogramin lyase